MIYKVKLKNSKEMVLLDDQVYEWLIADPYMLEINFINSLRLHSSGCAVFQKTWKKADGTNKTETIYLHKLIAEKYLTDAAKMEEKTVVSSKNGDKLDCRIENIVFRSRAAASRQRKSSSKTGYTGVYQESSRFRSVISINGKSIHIGMFDTAEEAALAYNKMSREVYGTEGKFNKIKL